LLVSLPAMVQEAPARGDVGLGQNALMQLNSDVTPGGFHPQNLLQVAHHLMVVPPKSRFSNDKRALTLYITLRVP